MKVSSERNSGQQHQVSESRPTAFEAGSAAAGCGFGCIREIIFTGLLLFAGYLLLATCTGGM